MVNNLILFFVILLISCSPKRNLADNQDNSCLKYEDKSLKMAVFINPTLPAEYPNGMAEAMSFILKNTIYPEQEELQVKATVCFIVDKMGKLNDVRIYKKELLSYTKLDLELVKAVRLMKNWRPAKCNSKKVASLVIMPLHIDIQ